MKPRRLLWALASLVGLLGIVFLLANFLVGSGSSTTVVDVARSKCMKDGFPIDKMLVAESMVDNGVFGFGGTATVTFASDPRVVVRDGWPKEKPPVLRVELRRRMNLSAWEVVGIKPETELPDYLRGTAVGH